MSSYFLDTSAIVKRYSVEQGHTWMSSLLAPDQGNAFYISRVAVVEVVAALCRKERQRAITLAERDLLVGNFRRDCRSQYSIVRVTNAIYTTASDLCLHHTLRAYDAIQLACTLAIRDAVQAKNLTAPIFVCADVALLGIAVSEKLIVKNPNDFS